MKNDIYKELKEVCYNAVRSATKLRPVFRQQNNTIEIFLPEIAEGVLEDIIYNLIKSERFNHEYNFQVYYEQDTYNKRLSEAILKNRDRTENGKISQIKPRIQA